MWPVSYTHLDVYKRQLQAVAFRHVALDRRNPALIVFFKGNEPVSYTHLDVYKRQSTYSFRYARIFRSKPAIAVAA